MGHHLTCFLGRPTALTHIPVPRLRLVALPQGLSLAPMPEALLREVIGERDMLPDEAMDELAEAASRAGPIGWLMSDWFGGDGSTEVALWEAGRRVPASQDEMLAALGVVRVRAKPESSGALRRFLERWGSRSEGRLLDAWDSLGLGNLRDTEAVYEAANPVEKGGA